MTEDRWEAFGDYDDDIKFNEGVMAERNRIIALLNSKDEWHYEFSDISDVIALIKGEDNA